MYNDLFQRVILNKTKGLIKDEIGIISLPKS